MSQVFYHRIKFLFVGIILAYTMMSRPLFAQNQSMFEAFWTYCFEQATKETHVPRTNLYKFSEDEIAQFSRNTGSSHFPEAVWASNDGSWIIIDMKIDEPQNCMAASFNDPLTKNIIEWNKKIANDDGFRSDGMASVRTRRSGGWATTPVEDGFVQVSLHNFLVSTKPFASVSTLTAVRVGLSPASCELFPSKCN